MSENGEVRTGLDGALAGRALGDNTATPPLLEPSVLESAVAQDVVFCNHDIWNGIADEIRGAESVEFFGIVPRPLIEALRSRLSGPGNDLRALPPITYYMPDPEEVLTTYNEDARARLALRWQVAFMGLRNLIDAIANATSEGATEPEPATTALFALPTSFSDCIIVIRIDPDEARTRYFGVLPLLHGASEASRFIELTPNTSDGSLRSYLRSLASDAKRLRLREVLCEQIEVGPHESTADAAIPELKVSALAPFADRRPQAAPPALKPVAIIAVRCPRLQGDQLLLKRRSVWEDIDQFDKLSFLSARVQEADLASSLNLPIATGDESDNDALETLWIRAKRPKPFPLPLAAFISAAKRELFVTCGLNIESHRLTVDGFFVLDDAESYDQFGFCVFHLALNRDQENDERSIALDRNPLALKAIGLGELAAENHEYDLNRLLRHGMSWLRVRTLAEQRGTPVDA